MFAGVRRRHRHADQRETTSSTSTLERSRAERVPTTCPETRTRPDRRPRLRSRARPHRRPGALEAQRRLLVCCRVEAGLQRPCCRHHPDALDVLPQPAQLPPGSTTRRPGARSAAAPVLCCHSVRGASTEHRNSEGRVQHDPGSSRDGPSDFAFGAGRWHPPGIDPGDIISVACKGSCGHDRTQPDGRCDRRRPHEQHGSDRCRASCATGIKGMLQSMTSSQQYVALGTIGRSGQTTTVGRVEGLRLDEPGLTYGSSSGSTGLWMPIAFSNDYQSAPGTLRPRAPWSRAWSACATCPTPIRGRAPGGAHEGGSEVPPRPDAQQPGQPAGADADTEEGDDLRDGRAAETSGSPRPGTRH